MNFVPDQQYNGQIKGFRYNNEYAFVVVKVEDATASLILGTKEHFPMKELMELKSCSSIDFTCKGEKTVNNVAYPQLRIECVNF